MTAGPGSLQAQLQALWIVSLALLMGTLLTAGACVVVLESQGKLETGLRGATLAGPLMGAIALGLSLACVALSFLMRAIRRASARQQPPRARVQGYRTTVITSLALCEGGALFGSVVLLLEGAHTMPILALALGFAGMLLHLPRRTELEELLGQRDSTG
jgi:hypothetical protein